MEQIYFNFGIEIYKRDNKYYMKYDAGELVVQMKEIEISEDEVNKITQMSNEKALYDFLIKNMNKRMYF